MESKGLFDLSEAGLETITVKKIAFFPCQEAKSGFYRLLNLFNISVSNTSVSSRVNDSETDSCRCQLRHHVHHACQDTPNMAKHSHERPMMLTCRCMGIGDGLLQGGRGPLKH